MPEKIQPPRTSVLFEEREFVAVAERDDVGDIGIGDGFFKTAVVSGLPVGPPPARTSESEMVLACV